MASVSENQYDPPTKTRPRTRPRINPPWPKNVPISIRKPPRAASSTKVLTVFLLISYSCLVPYNAARPARVPAGEGSERRTPSVLGAAGRRLLLDLLDHPCVGQGGGVAEVAALGHVAEEAAHDLAATGLGEVVRDDDGLRAGDLADALGHVLTEGLAELLVGLGLGPQDDVGDDGLAGVLVLGADHGRLGHARVVDQGRLHLGGGNAVPGHVHDVVDPAHEPEVAVVVDTGSVAREVP